MKQASAEKVFRFTTPVFLCLLLGCSAAAPLKVLEGDNFKIRSSLPHPKLGEFAGTVARIFEHYEELFGLHGDEIEELLLLLDNSTGRPAKSEYPALYNKADRSIHLEGEPVLMTLLHEIAHHFIQARLGEVPVWLNEGLAVYLGWSAMDEDELVVGEIPVVHFKILRSMAEKDELMPLAEFLELTPDEFYRKGNSIRNYSQAWGVVYYAFHCSFPRDLSFGDRLDLIKKKGVRGLSAMEEAFRRFCTGFSAALMMEERLTCGSELKRLSSAYRLGLLQNPSAMDALLEIAADQKEDARIRDVSLGAAGLIALSSMNWSVGNRFVACVRRLRYKDDCKQVRETARRLYNAFTKNDRKAVISLFAGLCAGKGFYPAGRFDVVWNETRFAAPSDATETVQDAQTPGL